MQVTCLHCKKTFELSDALQNEVLDEERKRHDLELQKMRLEEKEKAEKHLLEEKIEIEKHLEEEKREEKARREKLLEDLRTVNEQMIEMKRKDEEREIENLKKQQEDREKIKEEISKLESEKSQIKLAELQKQLDDTKKSLTEAQRKSSQISQQLQGEVLELQLEEYLKNLFPYDEIVPVKKGETGADIRHLVKSPKGYTCGTILWEFKRTKDWKDKWLEDLKNKLRDENANIPVIVSVDLPKDVKSIGLKEGVWVTARDFVQPLAELLRKNLLDVAYQKAVLANKTGKADLLYEYVTSDVFVHQVQSIVEVFYDMKAQINTEKTAFEKQWKAREAQIEKLVKSTAQIAGSISGKVGASMPQIKGLDILELEDGI